jgi:hypothetical protein
MTFRNAVISMVTAVSLFCLPVTSTARSKSKPLPVGTESLPLADVKEVIEQVAQVYSNEPEVKSRKWLPLTKAVVDFQVVYDKKFSGGVGILALFKAQKSHETQVTTDSKWTLAPKHTNGIAPSQALSTELLEMIKQSAATTKDDPASKWSVNGLEVTRKFGVTRSTDVQGSVVFQIITLGGEATFSSQSIQSVTLFFGDAKASQ